MAKNVTFNFTLEELDADSFLRIIFEYVNKCTVIKNAEYQMDILLEKESGNDEAKIKQLEAERDWFVKHGEYVKGIFDTIEGSMVVTDD